MSDTSHSPVPDRASTSHLPVWLPMTHMPSFERWGTTIVSGSGSRVTASNGAEFLSATSGLWNVAFGWGEARIVNAITEQLRTLSYGTLFRFAHPPAIELATRLLSATGAAPGSRVYFSSSGSSGIEAAVKVVRRAFALRQQAERRLVLSFARLSWHGTGIGAMAYTGEDIDQDVYGVDRSEHRFIPFPRRALRPGDEDVTSDAAIAALDDVLVREGHRVAAVVVEPILGSSGVHVPPDGYLRALAERVRRAGGVVVVDEVATGFGRTGALFGIDHEDVSPDVWVLSKAITGGYLPLAATLFPPAIVGAFDDAGTGLTHGETQSGNPAACAAALAVLDILDEDGIVQRVRELGTTFIEDLRAELSGDPLVAAVRGRGFMVGIEVNAPGYPERAANGLEVFQLTLVAQQAGLIVHPAESAVSLFPPLNITASDLALIVRKIRWSIDRWAGR